MLQIEQKLHELHAQARTLQSESPMDIETATSSDNTPVPFAHIDQVELNSPASSAVRITYVLLYPIVYSMSDVFALDAFWIVHGISKKL